MELNQLKNVRIQDIYKLTSDLSDKVLVEFGEQSKAYLNERDYDRYVSQLEGELATLESDFVGNYAQTKLEYGGRMLKNIQKRGGKGVENYMLMKVVGRN